MAGSATDGKQSVTLSWKIDHVSYWWTSENDKGIKSRKITTSTRNGYVEWYLTLFPWGVKKGDENLTLRLSTVKEYSHFPSNSEWSFVDCKGSPLLVGSTKNRFPWGRTQLDMPHCPKHEDVFVKRRSEFLPHNSLNIQFRIWDVKGSITCGEFVAVRSQINLEERFFYRRYHDFSTLQLDDLYHNYTPVWNNLHLVLSLKGKTLEDASVHFEVFADKLPHKIPTTVRIAVMNKYLIPIESMRYSHTFYTAHCGHQIFTVPELASRKQLIQKRHYYLPCDVLTICYSIVTLQGPVSGYVVSHAQGPPSMIRYFMRKHIFCPHPSCKNYRDSECALTCTRMKKKSCLGNGRFKETDLTVLRNSFQSLGGGEQTPCDFELVSGGVSFPVHKSVLMEHSPVFSAMFSSGMRECHVDSVDIPDLEPDTVNRMLNFLYTDMMEPDMFLEEAYKLYYAADKYFIRSLMADCAVLIGSFLTESNYCDILTLAGMHADVNLRSVVNDYFAVNYDVLMRSKEWKEFIDEEPVLAAETMYEAYKLTVPSSVRS